MSTNNFEKGKTYTCISTCGLYPVFMHADHENDESSEIYLEKLVLIQTGNEILNHHRDLNGFVSGTQYLCISEDPLILQGESTRTHKAAGTDWMEYAACMLNGLMADANGGGTPMPVLKVVLSYMEWQIRYQWDHTVQGLKSLIAKRIADYCDSYNGAPQGCAFWLSEKALFFSVFLRPEDAEILKKIKSGNLPDVSVTWEGSRRPEIRLAGELTVTEWVQELLKPGVPIPAEKENNINI